MTGPGTDLVTDPGIAPGSGRARVMEWLPPFLLGMGLAVSAEMALGLLLYSANGLMPALTLVVVVQLGALSAGIATRPPRPEASRTWRWLIAAMALLAAGILALLWSLADEIPQALLSRGVTLVVFAAAPMYGFGLVLGGIQTHLRGEDGRRWPGRRRPVGGPALLGATLGVLIVGMVLLPRFTPLSVYLFSLLCLASAAMLESSRRERARAAYLAIPSIAEFAPDPETGAGRRRSSPETAGVRAPDPPDALVPSIEEFAPDP